MVGGRARRKRVLHYGNDEMGYNLPHIHHSRHWTPWYRPPVDHCSGSSLHALFPLNGRADFNPVSLWNDNVYHLSFNQGATSVTHIPSFSKRPVNVPRVADIEEAGIVRPLRGAQEQEDSLTQGMNAQTRFLLPRHGSYTYTLHRSPYGLDS